MADGHITALDGAGERRVPPRGAVVAIGNFDGLHRGHRSVVAAGLTLARRLGQPLALLTFEPHPTAFFRPEPPMFRLTPAPMKARLAARLGAAVTIVVRFDAALASLSAQAFLDEVLGRELDVAGVVIGHDFHFGKGRSGSPATVTAWGAATGRPVEVVAPVGAADPAGPMSAISSTMVREALIRGDVAAATVLLGDFWTVRGTVVSGDRRGRELGFPTANIMPPPGFALRYGIYAVRAATGGTIWPAVASFGRRPTFDNGPPLLEVHLIGASLDLYGQTIDVSFVAWLRAEERFADVGSLIEQMERDREAARRIIAAA